MIDCMLVWWEICGHNNLGIYTVCRPNEQFIFRGKQLFYICLLVKTYLRNLEMFKFRRYPGIWQRQAVLYRSFVYGVLSFCATQQTNTVYCSLVCLRWLEPGTTAVLLNRILLR